MALCLQHFSIRSVEATRQLKTRHSTMTDGAVMTPGSATEAFEKSVGTPVGKDNGKHKRKKRCCSAGMTLLVIGAVMVLVSIVYSTALPSVVNSEITTGAATCKEEDVQAETFTDRYSDCEECTPYYYSLSMFNVTNAIDYLTKGAKLKVQEVGPYVYRRREIRVDVKLLEDGNKVSYKMYTCHSFEPTMSCEGCSDKDMVVSWDVGYLNVISQAGGERGFLRQLITGSFGVGLEVDAIDEIIDENGSQIMKWVNGLNSNESKAWKAIRGTVLPFLSAGAIAIAALKLDGFEYNGLFVRRSMSQWALGYPSLLAGLALGSNYVGECAGEGKLDEQCKNCKGDECLKIWAKCKRCSLGAKILAINNVTCATIESIYAAEYGTSEAKAFVDGTYATFCAGVGLCAAPLPGAAEDSGLDYSKTAPPSSILNEYVQRTGCDDLTKIGEYIQYDGFTMQPYWVKLDKRRNPTLEEINAFQVYGNCDAKTANITCADVIGQDATGIEPYGASISGFPGEVHIQELQMYLSQAKQNISLVNTGIVLDDISGIKMSRFIPPNDLLRAADWKSVRGTAYPVDGIQPLAFNVGFLAYLSYPLFLYGDKSLTDAVEITMYDGKVASNETLFENGELKKEYCDRYQTVVDIEPGTGKTMRARKRLQASYAMAKSQFTKDAPMSDILWPKLKAEVISPAYIGEESATITPKLIDTYKMAKGIASSFLPVVIAGVIVGVGLFAFGFMRRRREAGRRKQEFV